MAKSILDRSVLRVASIAKLVERREGTGQELLRKLSRCSPDPANGVAYNGEAMFHIAAKGEECAARMSALVDWFD